MFTISNTDAMIHPLKMKWVKNMNKNEVDFLLLEKRIIHIDDSIEDSFASMLVKKLIYLNNPPYDDAYFFINSPGGSITSSFAVYDTMRWCKYKIATVCLHQTAAIATLLLAAGSRGMRYAFADSIIKPALYYSVGNSDVLYSEKAAVINSALEKTLNIYAALTNNSVEMMSTICMTDHTLNAEEAQNYGYIDNIINLGSLVNLMHIDYFDIAELIQKLNKI